MNSMQKFVSNKEANEQERQRRAAIGAKAKIVPEQLNARQDDRARMPPPKRAGLGDVNGPQKHRSMLDTDSEGADESTTAASISRDNGRSANGYGTSQQAYDMWSPSQRGPPPGGISEGQLRNWATERLRDFPQDQHSGHLDHDPYAASEPYPSTTTGGVEDDAEQMVQEIGSSASEADDDDGVYEGEELPPDEAQIQQGYQQHPFLTASPQPQTYSKPHGLPSQQQHAPNTGVTPAPQQTLPNTSRPQQHDTAYSNLRNNPDARMVTRPRVAHALQEQHVASQPPLSRQVDSQETEAPQPTQLDYDLETLQKMSYNDLQVQSFDANPRAKPFALPSNLSKVPLEDKLAHFRTMTPDQQSAFFASLTLDEWEDAGSWFLQAFGELMRKMQQARRKKRDVAKEFEGLVAGRHEQVDKKRKVVDAELGRMKGSGEMVITPRKKVKS